MLSIRLQRTGRKGQAKFRVVVQDSRRTPTSGRVVANLGHYDPHSKQHGIDFDRLSVYLKNGAQPSDRVIHLLVGNDIDLPTWVKVRPKRQRSVRHPEKLRKNQPAESATKPTKAETKTDDSPPATDLEESPTNQDEVESQPPQEDGDQPGDDQESTPKSKT